MSVVLLVDDEPQMQGLVAMCLEGSGATVVQAANLEEALTAARLERPNVILLDIGLGEEDGLHILPSLRADPALAGVPVLMFSVHDSMRQDALDQGAAGFVTKPFRLEVLREAVKEHLP